MKIKDEILELFEDVKFIPGQDKKLVGYAEMFGQDCIPLYKDINFVKCSFEEGFKEVKKVNPKSRLIAGDYNSCVIGYLILDNTKVHLYDKNLLIEKIKSEYMEDTTGLFSGEEDCEISAMEWYDYNIIGAYVDGIPAFAEFMI